MNSNSDPPEVPTDSQTPDTADMNRSHRNKLAEFFREHRAGLVANARGRLPVSADADDAVSEAMLNTLAMKDPDTVNSVPAYVRQSTHNATVNLGKRQAMQQEKHAFLTSGWSATLTNPSLEDLLIERESEKQLLDLISTLPPKIRCAVELRVLYRYSYAEIVAYFDERGIRANERTLRRHVAEALEQCRLTVQAAVGHPREEGLK